MTFVGVLRSCTVLCDYMAQAKRAYASYKSRAVKSQRACIPLDDWLKFNKYRGVSLHQMTVSVSSGWQRGSDTFSSRLGELRSRSQSTKAMRFRSFCWMKGSSIESAWGGVWYGRIYYFAWVQFNFPELDQLHAGSNCRCGFDSGYGIAAIRVFSNQHISTNDPFGFSVTIAHGLEDKTHFISLDGIGGRIVLADHPDNNRKKIMLDIDFLNYPQF